MDIERGAIARVITDGAMTEALELNLTAPLFEGDACKVWAWMLEHYRLHSATPGVQAFEQYWPDYTLEPPTEVLSFYAVQLQRKFTYNAARDTIEAVAALLKKHGDPFKGIEMFRKAVAVVEDSAQKSPDLDWAATMQERIELYHKMKEVGGIDGLTTPFPTLDRATQGWHGGDLIIIAAESGIGKTWMLCICAHHNWTEGVVPLIIEKEMVKEQIGRRLDALHCMFPYQRLRHGELSEEQEREWEEVADELGGTHKIYIVDQAYGGVAHVAAKIERYRPGVCYVDGAYLLDDDLRGASQWERRSNVTRELKQLAKVWGIPIIITLQLNDDGDLAFYKGMKQDADVKIKLGQTEDQKLAGLMQMTLDKIREGDNMEQELNWNFDTMEFSELQGSRPTVVEVEDSPLLF